MTLTEFYAARLNEKEAAAKAAAGEYQGGGEWYITRQGTLGSRVERFRDADVGCPDGCHPSEAQNVHIALHDPARVLRQVEAGRKILAAYNQALDDQNRMLASPAGDQSVTYEWVNGKICVLLDVMRGFAAAESGHPDFDPKWEV